ncbi:hypothetical protein [Akkermansia glycaniphila]|uniref:Uncharacterized protein n=1 Tax=Akkermansia glycaniphila TaxID=1679444 RepID=A0A1C7PF51_9BACT|nr:hypothetical protein [Akkermansia glycaniphila]OCA02308.1 hypothetical protein AC781_10780 [Akkermansia glycaniphila]OCA04206.1 hypothetical protein AC781_00490 [Akkermansia glycaniphila]SEH87494.1 Hypothetical protein PYTT_1375 [Akkermansia glycaniphila]
MIASLPLLLAEAAPDGYISVATVAALIVAILGAAGAAGWKVNKTAREKGAEEERARLKTDTLISPTPLPIVKHPEYITRDEHAKLEGRVTRLEEKHESVTRQIFDRLNPIAETVAEMRGEMKGLHQLLQQIASASKK